MTGPRPRSARALWWDRTREAIGSDLAVHGLAYIGVLLFFVGAFGLVVFAFGDVELTFRPVAELVIALAPFAAAALLLRRGATVVGRALEVAGGLLVPVMLITGFLDDYTFPPDLYGVQLAVALTVLTSLVALAYAAWSWRHPHSALRYLVAPVTWLAVGMATLGLGPRDIPDGKAVATPGAAQSAAILAALVVTVALARFRPTHLLSRPTRVAALPGLAVIGAISVLSWVRRRAGRSPRCWSPEPSGWSPSSFSPTSCPRWSSPSSSRCGGAWSGRAGPRRCRPPGRGHRRLGRRARRARLRRHPRGRRRDPTSPRWRSCCPPSGW